MTDKELQRAAGKQARELKQAAKALQTGACQQPRPIAANPFEALKVVKRKFRNRTQRPFSGTVTVNGSPELDQT